MRISKTNNDVKKVLTFDLSPLSAIKKQNKKKRKDSIQHRKMCLVCN